MDRRTFVGSTVAAAVVSRLGWAAAEHKINKIGVQLYTVRDLLQKDFEGTLAKVAALAQMFPDCGGGWQIYWRQSIPGLGTRAKNADGSTMKNWWPLLFY